MEFKKQLEEKHKNLTIATIFSFSPNEEDNANGILEDESFDTDILDQSSRDFLEILQFLITIKYSRQILHIK